MVYHVYADGRLEAKAFDESTARRIGAMFVRQHAHNVYVINVCTNEVLYFSR